MLAGCFRRTYLPARAPAQEGWAGQEAVSKQAPELPKALPAPSAQGCAHSGLLQGHRLHSRKPGELQAQVLPGRLCARGQAFFSQMLTHRRGGLARETSPPRLWTEAGWSSHTAQDQPCSQNVRCTQGRVLTLSTLLCTKHLISTPLATHMQHEQSQYWFRRR